MRVRLGLLCGAALGLLGSVLVSCGDEPPPPGFENVAGASGDGGQGGQSSAPGSTTGAGAGGQTSTSTSTSTSSGTSTSTSTSTSTGTGGFSCMDEPSEPNDSESSAQDLGTTSDCSGDEEQVVGVIAGVADIDWYKYSGVDEFGFNCSVNPVRVLTSSDPARLCKYVQCIDEQPDFVCPAGTTPATSPDQRAGCCGAQGFTLDFICGSSSVNDDSATVYMSLETDLNVCVVYTLEYDF